YLLATTADLWTAPPASRPELQSDVASARSTFESSSERLVDSVDRSSPRAVRAAVSELEPPMALQRLVDGAIAGQLTDPDRDSGQPVEAGVALLNGVDWLLGVDDVTTASAAWATDASRQVSEDARANQRMTAALALLAIGVSIAAAVWFGRSIVRPVRRLTDRAQRIGRGQLDPEPPERKGPPEIVRASSAMDDMAQNLVLLEQKSHALARAEFDDPSLHQPLPGRLGGALQLSMEVLSASVEQREALQSRLEFEATHDSLTGVGNRSSLTTLLRQMDDRATSAQERSALVFIDLDDFKGVNDRHGHTAGDHVLQVAASRMLEAAPARALVARLGGDEFVIAIPAVDDMDEPVSVARRVIQRITVPIELDGRTIEIGASAGVALAGPDVRGGAVSPLALLHMADLAVYTAKHGVAEDIAVYDDALDRRLTEERDVETALAAALHAEGELHLLFQPIVAAADGQVRAVEALLRWHRSGVGPVMPDDFIPVAERSNLILDVDHWVIETALRQLASWQHDDATSSLAVAVNVSGRSLLDRSFVDRVMAALEGSGVAPERLWLEITETALVSDLELAATQLRQLRAIGLRIAIDDFGTGYTSVAHLRALPVDELKIDASFVRQLPEQENRVLIELITQVAHQLHVPTVAEGVETEEQLSILQGLGCDALQGYYFSRPLAPDALRAWLTEHRAHGAMRGAPNGRRVAR
ncbi:MAG: putative bifunctional diguanylate cyclase/phosphodiesterase, partial [Microthrixaceae bacterium]